MTIKLRHSKSKNNRFRGVFVKLLLVCVLCFGGPFQAANAASVEKEYRIKAALLINLLRFSSWPSKENDSPSTLCIVGQSNLAPLLPTIEKQKIKGKPIAITKVEEEQISTNCNVLFISKSAHLTQSKIKALNEMSILTVGEDKNILKQGGLVGLVRRYRNNNFTISLEINLKATLESGIKISSDVIQLATVVEVP